MSALDKDRRTITNLYFCFIKLQWKQNTETKERRGRKRETRILLNSSPCTWSILMTHLTNKYINWFNTYFKIAYVIWHPTYRTNAKSQLQGHLLSLTTHFSKIFYFPMAQVSGCMPCLYQTMKHGASSVKQATQACSEPKFNGSTILEKAFYEQYLEANWHCWIYFRFY